ncbi:MAG: ISNCY family transposase [Deltaproteobacteria bacterium]
MRNRHVQRSFAELEFALQGVRLEPVLQQISDFLDRHGELCDLVEADLLRGLKRAGTGRAGLGAEQVLRSFLLWRIKDWPYRELRERIADGYTLRQFTRFGAGAVAKADAFQRSFVRLTPVTVRHLNEAVLQAIVTLGLEDAQHLRVDTMVVETNVHYPTDSTLLWDCVRVLSRLVRAHLAAQLPEASLGFSNHTRRARRRMQEIARMRDRKGKRQRAWRRKYGDLLTLSHTVMVQARHAADTARATPVDAPLQRLLIDGLCAQIDHYAQLTERVIDQTRRRVCAGETVAAAEKLYSIFEPHTDLLKRGKARKPVEFGHKVFLAESRRGFITDYRVLDGNPIDSDQVEPSLREHRRQFGAAPRLYTGDRGFDSEPARTAAAAAQVQQLVIPQRGGKLSEERAAEQHSKSFKQAQRFRVGIEGTISVLMRGRGMRRCRLAGPARFEMFVGVSVLANNLMRLAARLAKRTRRPALSKAA